MGFRFSVDDRDRRVYLQIEAPTARGAVRTDLEARTASCFGCFAPRGWLPVDVATPGFEDRVRVVYINPEEVSRSLSSTMRADRIEGLTRGQLKVILGINTLFARSARLDHFLVADLRREIRRERLGETLVFEDREFIERLVTICPEYILDARFRYQEDLGLWRQALSRRPELLRLAPNAVKDDVEIVKEVVNQDGFLIEHAGPRTACHPEVIAIALRDRHNAIELVRPSYLKLPLVVAAVFRVIEEPEFDFQRADSVNLLKRFLRHNPNAWAVLNPELLERPVVRVLAQREIEDSYMSPENLERILRNSRAIREDQQLARVVCYEHPSLIDHVGANIRSDHRFLTDFVLRFPEMIDKVPHAAIEEILSEISHQFMTNSTETIAVVGGDAQNYYLRLIKHAPSFVRHLQDYISGNPDFIKQVFLVNPAAFKMFPDHLIHSLPFIVEFAQRVPDILSYVQDERLRRQAIEQYLRSAPDALQRLPYYCQLDLEPIIPFLTRDPSLVHQFSPNCFGYPEFIGELINRVYPGIEFPFIFEKVSANIEVLSIIQNVELKKQIIRELIVVMGDGIRILPEDVQRDLDLILPFILDNPQFVEHLSESLFLEEEFLEELIKRSVSILDRIEFMNPLINNRIVLPQLLTLFNRRFDFFLHCTIPTQSHLMMRDPRLLERFIRDTVENKVPDHLAVIDGKRFVVNPIPKELASHLRLNISAAEGCSWERLLDRKVRLYVQTLPSRPMGIITDLEQPIIYQEDAASALEEGIVRIRDRRAFLGTPRQDQRELVEMFYRHIEFLLAKIDEKVSEDPTQDIEEKKQIIRALGVCGGGWQAQFESMETVLCEVGVGTPFSVTVAKMVSNECKSVVQVLNLIDPMHPGDVHTTNGMMQVTRGYLGNTVLLDHLAYLPANPHLFARRFSERFSPRSICESIREQAFSNEKLGEEFAKFRDHELFKNTRSSPLLEQKVEEKQREMEMLLEDYEEKSRFIEELSRRLERLDSKKELVLKILGRPSTKAKLRADLVSLKQDSGENLLSDEELTYLLENQSRYGEILSNRLELQQLTGFKGLIFDPEVSKGAVIDAFLANRQHRIDEAAVEWFIENHMDETGRYKPSGIAIILTKVGLFKEI